MVTGLATFSGLEMFEQARARIVGYAIRTPLVRLQLEGRGDIYLKLENLQPVGSFKIRCAANALLSRAASVRAVSTASAGNFAQGLAYVGKALGIVVKTYVPENAARSKIEALQRLGAEVAVVPYDRWWEMLAGPVEDPSFIHPAVDREVLAGNGTIGLEIADDIPDVATVIVPYGGGGLSVGIAAALRARGVKARTIACETEAGAPVRAAFAIGAPVRVPFDPKSFVTGMGSPRVISAIWPLVQDLIDGTELVSFAQTAAAIKLLVERHHVVAEGAGAAAVAAALAGQFEGPVVCIVSGGHLDTGHLQTILSGGVP